jgi:hypothetical protein
LEQQSISEKANKKFGKEIILNNYKPEPSKSRKVLIL